MTPNKSQLLKFGPRARFSLEVFAKFSLWVCGILTLLSLTRFAAYFLYGRSLEITPTELLEAFLLGFRFDLSATCYVIALPVLIAGPWLALGTARSLAGLSFFLRVYLTLFSFVIALLSVVDLVYYSYFQDHINIMVFGFFEDDTRALLHTFWANYPVVWILGSLALATFLLWKLFAKFSPRPPLHEWSKSQPGFLPLQLILILTIALGARGSFGLFPLGVADASISKKAFVNYLAFSGIHSLHRAVKLRLRERSAWNINERNFGYDNAYSAARDFFEKPDLPPADDPLTWLKRKTPANAWAEKTRPHVVVLMMESFGSYWLQWSSPKFDLLGELQKHFASDYLFSNFVPSMTATIGSLSALMIDTPHRPEGGFLTESRYLQVPFRTAPARLFKTQGYRTRFIYGGAIGWRDIDKFARTQGFESVEGDYEIEAKAGHKLEKHDWGLFDEDVWNYLETTLKEAKTPELVVIMTTTNHPPYQLPSTYRPGPLEIPTALKSKLNVDENLARARFQAFQYSNQKLGEFLTRLKASELGEKTLLAATGDHGFLIVNFDETDLLHKWQVPFYLYVPKAARPKKVDLSVFGSHADIFPTLMNLSLSNAEVNGFGTDMLDPSARHEAYHFSRLAFSKEGAVIVENAKTTRYFTWKGPSMEMEPATPQPALESLSKRYKALMSFLDEFYEFERKHARSGSPDENSRR